jgi:hypothetical protein
MAVREAAAAFLLTEEGNGAFAQQDTLFGACRGSDPRLTFRLARAAVLEALEEGALIHPRRRWALGIDCWAVICEVQTLPGEGK